MKKYFIFSESIYFEDYYCERDFSGIFTVDCEKDMFIDYYSPLEDEKYSNKDIKSFLKGERGRPSEFFDLISGYEKKDLSEEYLEVVAFDSFDEALSIFLDERT